MCTRAKSKTEREKKGGGRGDMSEVLCEVMRSISRSPLPENLEAELGICSCIPLGLCCRKHQSGRCADSNQLSSQPLESLPTHRTIRQHIR